MFIDEFKQCIHSDIKTYLDEHKVSLLAEASTMADDYALTHKCFENSSSWMCPKFELCSKYVPFL